MKFKRVFAAVMAAALAVTICGCNDNSESPNATKDNSSKNSSVSDSNKGGNSGNTNDSGNNNDQNGDNGDIFDNNSTPAQSEPVKVGIWDVLPEIPVTAASAFKYEYSSSYGGMVVTDYLKESPKIRIPDTLEGEPVVYVDLYDCNKALTEIIMPDTVNGWKFNDKIRSSLKYINYPRDTEDHFFKNFSNIEAVYIAEGVTKLTSHFFASCDITNITIPNSVTTIGDCAFDHCTSLTSINIPNGVTRIGYRVFYYCTSLTSINIPDSVTKIDRQSFYGCEKIQATYKGKTYTYDQINVLYDDIIYGENTLLIVDNVVTDCRGDATQVVIPDSVTEIGESAFSGCSSLTSITIPNSVTAIGREAFKDCSGLTSITIPNSVTNIDHNAFRECNSLTSITIPDGVTMMNWDVFIGCKNIQATYKGKTYDYEHINDLYKAINGN